jgi:hypothetical protein
MGDSLTERLGDGRAEDLLAHPLHRWATPTLVGLVRDLRHCRSMEDFYHFQQTMIDLLLNVEEQRAAVSRTRKMLRRTPDRLPAAVSIQVPASIDAGLINKY